MGLRGIVGAVLAALCLGLVGAATAGASGAASTFTVTGFGDGPGSCGTVDANGNVTCTTLRAAVNRADTQANSPTIELQAGTYQLTAGNGGQLDLATSMNIIGTGPGGPSGTTIQQTDGQNRVLEINGTSRLSGLEITGGHYAPAWSSSQVVRGGGIMVSGVLTLENSLITENQAIGGSDTSSNGTGDSAQGGGVDFAPGAPAGSSISQSTISNNKAIGGAGGNSVATSPGAGGYGLGGGIDYEGTGALALENTTLSGNQAAGGNGGNKANTTGGGGGQGSGGAIFDYGGLAAKGDLFSGNTATGGDSGGSGAAGGMGFGGGIASEESPETIINSTFFANRSIGGPGTGNGFAGTGSGGGLWISGSASTLSLASDTFDSDQADQAGNLFVYVGGNAPPYPFTIHDTILTGGSLANCQIKSPPSSESYNLEDDTAGSCGFSAANHDLVGASPQLQSAPSSNGGPTQTLEPALGSPVLGAGGECTDPTSNPPNQPLTADQRGEPRPAICDIGAFQAQSPKVTVLPAVSGSPARGQTLICTQGSWRGDGGPFEYAFAWLRNGVPIQGASTNTYVVGTADPGQSLACRVTATYYGAGTATSPLITVTSYPFVTILKVSAKAGRVVVTLGCRGTDGQRCTGLFRLIVYEKLRRGKVTGLAAGRPPGRERSVIVGQQSYSLLARHTAAVTLALKTNGSGLLKRFKGLPVLLTITQSTAAGTTTVASRKLKLRPARPPRRRG